MSKISSIDNDPVIVPIHFGNDTKHEISEKSLLALLSAYKNIINEVGLDVEIHLTTPTDGGWRTKLILFFSISYNLLNGGIVPLLTGYTSEELGKMGHPELVRIISEFLTKPNSELKPDIPNECIKHKNKMYQQFQFDACIEYIEIDQSQKIMKHDFNQYITKIEEENDPKCIYIGERNIIVSSPDWKNKRSWKGAVDNDEVSFRFDLDLTGKFWEKIKLDQLDIHTGTDNMLVQLAMCENVRPKYLVIRVIKYNDMDIDNQLMIDDLNKILLLPDVEPDLFSEA